MQNSNYVDIAAAQLEVIDCGTKNFDGHHPEVVHVLLDPTFARLDPILNYPPPKHLDGVIGMGGCCTDLCIPLNPWEDLHSS